MKTTSSENFKNDSLSFEEFQEAIEKRIKAAIHHEQAAEVIKREVMLRLKS